MSESEVSIGQALAGLMPRLRRFAYGLTGSSDDADELVQATYVRALERLEQWQAGTRLDSWLYRIAHSIHVNRLQAANVRHRYQHPGDIDPETQASAIDGSRVAEAQLTLAAIRDFIAMMPDEQRVVILLTTVEGLSYKEVAETLDLPIGTVTSRLARARIALNDFVHRQPTDSKPLTEKTA